MPKIDYKLLDDITTRPTEQDKNNVSNLYVSITQQNIRIALDPKEVGSYKVDSFHTRLYYIPQELIKIFEENHKKHISQIHTITEFINTLSYNPEYSSKDIFDTIKEHRKQLFNIPDHINAHEVLENYITWTIIHTAIPWFSKHHRSYDSQRMILLASKIKETDPQLKKILDTVALDIANDFEFHIQAKRKHLSLHELNRLLWNKKITRAEKRQLQYILNKELWRQFYNDNSQHTNQDFFSISPKTKKSFNNARSQRHS